MTSHNSENNIKVGCMVDSNYHVFEKPDTISMDQNLTSLSGVNQNTNNGNYELKFNIKQSDFENLKSFQNTESIYEGKGFPLRNHLIALKRQPDGSLKIYPIQTYVKFQKVFNNDVKLKVTGKDDFSKNSIFSKDANKKAFRIEDS